MGLSEEMTLSPHCPEEQGQGEWEVRDLLEAQQRGEELSETSWQPGPGPLSTSELGAVPCLRMNYSPPMTTIGSPSPADGAPEPACLNLPICHCQSPEETLLPPSHTRPAGWGLLEIPSPVSSSRDVGCE